MTQKTYISVIIPLKIEWEPSYYVEAEQNVGIGERVKVLFAGKEYTGVVSATDITPETDTSKIKPIKKIESELERILPEEITLWRHVAEYYMCTIGEVYKAAYPAGKINLEEAHAEALAKTKERKDKLLASMNAKLARIRERILKKQELIAKSKDGTKARVKYTEELGKIMLEQERAEAAIANFIAMSESPAQGVINDLQSEIILSPAQTKAYEQINEEFGKGRPVLLHGLTGSGKTEIYLKLAQEALSKGKNVLYLVPEIALSRQLEDRLRDHLGDRLLVFHSGKTAAEKRNTAEAIRSCTKSGCNYVILGTRSALFLPHNGLGLIVVDEEHDSSYKQDSPAPRYNGRDTALMLSVIHKCDIILGSATPSLEELYNCECGKHAHISLNERFHGSDDAEIEIVDTKAERRKRGMHGNFSRKLIDHIRRTLKDGGQVMILRSRRAWSLALQCEECGEIQKCPHCNVSLSQHKQGHMVCHYCGYKTAYTGHCCKCNGTLKSLGAGTQKIEEEAAALFPEARIARLDSDTAQNRTYESKTIKDFSKGEIDILIGTQMLTKGFDFSNLSLVAVIAADTLLGIQDFRADEKALQLFEQFRGRCGRRGGKGLFVIQTSQPEHPLYQRITDNECTLFNQSLLEERREFNFPPYTRIIEITIRDRFEDRAARMSMQIAKALKTGTITGPYTPAVDKIADEYIRGIRISLPKDRNLKANKEAIARTILKIEKDLKYSGHITINVDPS